MELTDDHRVTTVPSFQDRSGQVRVELLDILATIGEMLDEIGLVSEPARVAADRLLHNRFDIVVLGQYKRGKTTFIFRPAWP